MGEVKKNAIERQFFSAEIDGEKRVTWWTNNPGGAGWATADRLGCTIHHSEVVGERTPLELHEAGTGVWVKNPTGMANWYGYSHLWRKALIELGHPGFYSLDELIAQLSPQPEAMEEQVSLGDFTKEDVESLWDIGGYVTKTIAKDGNSKEILLSHVGSPQEGKPRHRISFIPHFEDEDGTGPIPDHYKNCKYGGVGRCRADCTHQYTNLPKEEVSSSSPAKVGIELTEEEIKLVGDFLDRFGDNKLRAIGQFIFKQLPKPPVELPEPKEPELRYEDVEQFGSMLEADSKALSVPNKRSPYVNVGNGLFVERSVPQKRYYFDELFDPRTITEKGEGN